MSDPNNGRGRGRGGGGGGGRGRGYRGKGNNNRDSSNQGHHNNNQAHNGQGSYNGNPNHGAASVENGNNVGGIQFKFNSKPKRKFEGPTFGFKRLYNFLSDTPNDVLMSLNNDKDTWKTYLEDEEGDLHGEKLILLIHVLGEKVCADVPILLQQQSNILNGCCSQKFCTKLVDCVSKIGLGHGSNLRNRNPNNDMPVDTTPIRIMENIYKFCLRIIRAMPHAAVDYFASLIVASTGAAVSCDPSMQLCVKFKDLSQEITEILAHQRKQQETLMKRQKRGFDDFDLAEFDQETPPDDIKDITIIPTIDELLLETPPYLRPNKSRGGYTNSEHYLDVQFRLLREDFVCPIRTGVRTFKKNQPKFVKDKKDMPVGTGLRLYHDVTMIKVEKERDTVVYKLQLTLSENKRLKNVKWDKSKRLLVGSLLLFTSSANCFKTAYFAIVFSRNVKELEKGIVTVTWVASPPPFDKEENYLMFESEVYLEAYRHTLDILQKLELDPFPMKKFIVDASSSVDGPRYLKDATTLLKVKLVSGEERYIAPLQPQQWPSSHDFGFDENQLQAFKAAISKEFSIIQGPPGTGKTFLGLKIAQVLLNNSNLWKSEQGNPITVVCYTNHALDQFLEGILKYYEEAEIPAEIIRIGGRCKSETLAKYTLREVRSRNRRRLPPTYWASERIAKEEINDLEYDRGNKMNEVIGLQDVQGIVDFEKLSVWTQIQIEFPKEVWNKFQDLKWFGISDQQLNIGRISEVNTCSQWFTVRPFPKNIQAVQQRLQAKQAEQKNAEENDDDDEDYDLDELMESRLVDDILLEAETGQGKSGKMGKLLTYYPDCSVDSCETSVRSTNRNLMEQIRRMNPHEAAPYKQSAQTQVGILENRGRLLKEIFRLHKEQYLDLPDVKDLIEEIQKKVGTVHFDRLKWSEKWALYFAVVERARILTAESVSRTEVNLSKAQNGLRQLIQHGDGMILRDCKVVGLTTTGAAKYNNLLKMMQSKIVIVEEAAEVFESHIVTCITEHCEQLILIGDHRQLRPSPTVYDLAIKYHLDLSLFERMINNNLNCYQLKMQHRMRPDIADLVVGPIYEELLNHESVKHYPDVQGVAKNVFFISHTEYETADSDSCSKSNVHEAKFIAAFCRYLKLQGYRSDQITVLTMYMGQMFMLKKEISQTCQGVRITCVDNYQGEENDIILLSLVRSNTAGNIGFLKTDNRVCVALSRAKHGLYVIGNMGVMAEQSKTWRAVVDKLEAQDAIGPSLELVCQIHSERTKVQNARDFSKVPEGGCQVLCESPLACTHICTRVCHIIDREHEKYTCREKCVKRCGNNHPCKGWCFEPCPPCKVLVEKTLECELQHKKMIPCHRSVKGIPCSEIVTKTLPCGHQEVMACHVDMTKYACKVPVEKTLVCGLHTKTMECCKDPKEIRCKVVIEKSLKPHCEHSQKVECFVAVESVKCHSTVIKKFGSCGHQMEIKCQDRGKPLSCKNPCTTRLQCGHACVKVCHVNDDPDHKLYECKKECQRDCEDGHKCKGNHHCYKKCPPCKAKINRTLPCNHQKELECYIDRNEYECLEQCERIIQDFSCRHKCPNLCFQSCGPCTMKVRKRASCGHSQEVFCPETPRSINCEELVKPVNTPECGHRNSLVPCKYSRKLPAEVVLYCNQNCEQQHDESRGGCGHKCSGTCASCFQGRIHQKCNEECGKQLVCGHRCDVPCSMVCPPCKKPCLMKCEHSGCTKKCGEPCSECKEPCSWSCPHVKCTKLCGEMCNRDPCDKPCPEKLSCGHQCVGFCGETCPPLCRECNHEELTETFFGTEDEEDARFVYLPDCRHTIEAEGLEGWLTVEAKGKISSKKCPKCSTTIRNCRRFGNIIRAHYSDVTKVKTMSFGNKANSEKMRVKCVGAIGSDAILRVFPKVQSLIKGMLVEEVRTREGQTRFHAKVIDEYSMRSIEFLADSAIKSANTIFSNKTDNKLNGKPYDVVVAQYRKMLDYMVTRQPMSRLEMINFNEELDRLDYFRQLMMRRSIPACNRDNTLAYPLYSSAKQLVTSTQAFTSVKKDGFLVLLKKLDDALRSGLGISDREKMEILHAMGMRQGHWFKCPNGHIYAIGDCGGAMMESRCNECKAPIGGGRHQLRRDNQLAREMDGAQAAAWPQ